MTKPSTRELVSSLDYRKSPETQEPVQHAGFEVKVVHKPHDPDGLNRILISQKDMTVELLPTRALAVGEAFYKGRPIFWDLPAGLFDPDELDVESDEICLNGKSQPGMVYIKTFTGSIELLGLSNWGMHYTDPDTKELQVLHGELPQIPVNEITLTISEDSLRVDGTFMVRTFKGDPDKPWYERGKELYKVTKSLLLQKGRPTLHLTDTITNISDEPLTPDWGYHVTLRPENGAAYLIPSKAIANRGGAPVPPNHHLWSPSGDGRRVEVGIIHQGLKVTPGALGDGEGVRSLLRYPDGTGIVVTTPPVPYFQTWFCAGGAGTDEFAYADGTPVLTKNWDGQGIEIGASSLDHDGNVDPAVAYEPVLQPGASRDIQIRVEVLSVQDAATLADEIAAYNVDRVEK